MQAPLQPWVRFARGTAELPQGRAWCYRQPMPHRSSSHRKTPRRLLSVEQVRAQFAAVDPAYGAGFSEAEWERITDRLEAFARLLWRIAQRKDLGAAGGRMVYSAHGA